MRLDKILSNMGYGTRKEVRNHIKHGNVSVNGIVARDGGINVDIDKDLVTFIGQQVKYKQYIYLMMNKPSGVLSATEDAHGKPTAIDLLGEDHDFYAPAPAGRLDIDTEGFLLLTNDGDFIHNIISPSKNIEKVYFCQLEKDITQKDIDAFEKGIIFADGTKCRPGKLIKGEQPLTAYVTITEGKFHQVKKMFLVCGNKVTYLKRISIGGVKLDPNLQPGEYRELTRDELSQLTN